MKNPTIFITATTIFTSVFILLQTCTFGQAHYGDLELTVLGNGNQSAINIPVKAVDEDLGTTTYETTDNDSKAYFDELYIYTIDNIAEHNKKMPSLKGEVKIYNILGQQVDEKIAINGTVLFDDANHSARQGIHILQDSDGHYLKFLYMNKPTLLGKNIPSSFKFSALSETRSYELHADGRNLEWNPFAEFMEVHELEADIINYVQLSPPVVSDGPSTGQVEILVDGEPAGDGSEVKIVKPGTYDTTYLVTTNGIAVFDADAGITSHPFGNYTRTYTILINSYDADSNWFHAESNNVEMALGAGNNFTFNPAPYTDAERTANITLSIILTNGMPATSNAEVKTYKVGETDTTFAYTNAAGIAEFERLLNPYYAEEHEIAINSDLCNDTIFVAMTELHELIVGQNDIEMNPDSVAENIAEGPVRVRYINFLTPGVEVNIWRLNNTIDTVMYISNGAGFFYYENLPLEGSSSDYVFESYKEPANGDPTLTSLDTFNLVTGVNPMQNIYLEAINQFITATGTLRYAVNQSVFVSGANVEIREPNNGSTIGSAVTDSNGFYSISGIPSGAETEFFVSGVTDCFNKVNPYTFGEVFVYEDTLVENNNMFVYPQAWDIPQTDNDPAPETVNVDPGLIGQLAYGDEKNAEETIRNTTRLHLMGSSTSDSAYINAVIAACDSLFHGGNGSPLVLVPNQIFITTYHQLNYDPLVGFPGELGYNVTFGGGNTTTTIHSNPATGYYILGGSIEITGGLNNLESGIKELKGRVKQMGAIGVPGMMYPTQTTYPNHTERAYDKMSNINIIGRIVDDYEIFPLTGLTTTTTAAPTTGASLKPSPARRDL